MRDGHGSGVAISAWSDHKDTMPSTRTIIAVLLMATTLVFASGCRLVGSGTLGYVSVSVPDEPAATTGSTATIQAIRPDPGDGWPPPGKLGMWVRADHIPPTGTGQDHLYLVRLFGPQEPTLRKWDSRTCDELTANSPGRVFLRLEFVVGPLHIGDDRVINEVLLVDDLLLFQDLSWVIANEDATYSGQAIRCGTLTVAPP